jgi:peptidoglycan/LPS O-acetylase OafA/YrhL
MAQDAQQGRLIAFPPNLPALTSIRFFLALGVVLFHYQLQWPWETLKVTGLLDRARLGVDAFFILSGFVLTHAYRAALDRGAFSYRRFLIARFARIYPAHLAILTFVVVMVIGASIVGAEFDRNFYNPLGLATTLLLVHAWLPEVITAEWNGPSWSLSAEWFAYLAFPAFALIGLRLKDRPVTILVIAAAIFLGLDLLYQTAFEKTVVHAEANLGILRIIPEFLYGIGLYRLGQRVQLRRRSAVAFAWLSAVTLLLLMHLEAGDRIIVVMAGPLILSLALLSKTDAVGLLGRSAFLLGGEASYALYLAHMPILIAWKGIVSALRGMDSHYTLAWWEVGCLLLISIAAAVALHLVVEGPARRWIRQRAGQPESPRGSEPQISPGSQPPDL